MTAKDDREKERVSRETLGKYFYDLSKTSFASFVVANVIAIFVSDNVLVPISLILFGVVATVVLAVAGYRILKR